MFQLIRPIQKWKSAITATEAEINTQCDLSAQGFLVKTKKLAIAATPTGAEQSTGFQIPAKSIVLGVYLDVTTAEATGATKTMDVGLLSSEAGGDADGFMDGVAVDTTGLKKATLLNSGQTLGALLRVDEGGTGELVPEAHVCNTTARTVTFTAGSADWAEFRGSLNVIYAELA